MLEEAFNYTFLENNITFQVNDVGIYFVDLNFFQYNSIPRPVFHCQHIKNQFLVQLWLSDEAIRVFNLYFIFNEVKL